MQRQFERREVDKRYIAWLDGDVAGDEGTIDLPLRVDLDDRPRQIVDPEHGRPALTEWRVLERRDGRTRVAFSRAPDARTSCASTPRIRAVSAHQSSAIACTAARALDCSSTPRRWRLPTLTRERAWSLQTLLHSKRHALPRARR